MASPSVVEFAPFRLDLVNEELWRGSECLRLRGKPFAVLAYLATHPARLVPRDELAKAVWPDTNVGEGLLRGYVRELRRTLGDNPAAPRFIETIARRGYRFVAPVGDAGVRVPLVGDARAAESPAPLVVGRKAELEELERLFAEAAAGARRVVFVTGEAGIGKTTLVDRFIRAVRSRAVRTARGQCIEHFGVGEPYLPLLEALGGLCRGPNGAAVIAVLARHAPTWLVEMPALVADAELESVRRLVQGTNRERMLRELAEAVEVLATAEPLVLVLEDLHWSDPSTLDVLSSIARRREPARLFVVATVRTADVAGGAQPLAILEQDLLVHGLCSELALPSLSPDDLAEYLVARFPDDPPAPDLHRSIHHATEGNPLFVVTLVDAWNASETQEQELRLRTGGTRVPETLRQMIGQQLDQLPADARRLLEAASVAGTAFSTATVAAALEESEDRIDEECETLAARGLFLRDCGVDTDMSGAFAGRYAFVHALHRQVLYERVSANRRARLHRRIGAWHEGAYGARVHEHAAELAVHFEKGHEPERAVHHLEVAARNAMRLHAYREGTALLGTALDLLAGVPDAGADRELSLRMALGTALLTTRGYAAPEVHAAYARAHAICRHADQVPELPFALAGLFRFFFVRGEFERARELGEQVLRLAETRHPALLAVGHTLVGLPCLSLADLPAARSHLERAAALYDFAQHRALSSEHGDDPGITSLGFLAIALWFAGLPDQALVRIREADALAEQIGSPYGIAFAHSFAAWIHVRRGEAAEAQARCDALMRIAAERDFAFFFAEGAIFRGWALVQQGHIEPGLQQLNEGLAAHGAAGALMGRPSHLALLADAFGRAGRPEEGVAAVNEALALVAATGERSYEAELHRIHGELLAAIAQRTAPNRRAAEARACFERAVAVAREGGARSLELRALSSLVRFDSARRRDGSARRALREALASFTEGFETPDLVAARALLDVRAATSH